VSRAISHRAAAGLAAAALTLAWSCAALAHHSFASFDTTRIVRLDGVVAEFQWTNPHAWLELDVVNPDGETDRWGIEFNSPNNLTREGWSRHMLQPGDEVTALVNPLRDGRHGGLYYQIAWADGRVMTVRMLPFTVPEDWDPSTAPSAYDTPG
jgi:hypothetical protein